MKKTIGVLLIVVGVLAVLESVVGTFLYFSIGPELSSLNLSNPLLIFSLFYNFVNPLVVGVTMIFLGVYVGGFHKIK